MWISLSKGQKCDWGLHPCLVRSAKDSHHPELPLIHSICDEDSQWCDLLSPCLFSRASSKVTPGLAPHFRHDLFCEKSLQYHPKAEGAQTRQFINRHPFIHRECWDQTRVIQEVLVALCSLGMMGLWLWHPEKRVKSIRFVFDWMGSMEIPGGVFFWFGCWVVGLIWGLLASSDLRLIMWSTEWESGME